MGKQWNYREISFGGRADERMTWSDDIMDSVDMSLSKFSWSWWWTGSLACCSPWGCRAGPNWVTELMDWNFKLCTNVERYQKAIKTLQQLLIHDQSCWSIYLTCSNHADTRYYHPCNPQGISSVQPLSCVQFLWAHGLQHVRPPCPSPTPGVYSNSCPLSWWCHPSISSSVDPFSSCLQSFPASGSFQWVCSSHQVAKVLEFQLQPESFQWIFRTDFL